MVGSAGTQPCGGCIRLALSEIAAPGPARGGILRSPVQHKNARASHVVKSASGAAIATCLFASGAAADVVSSTWTGFGDGSHWTDGANWSTDPQFPNDGGGHGYIARIDQDPGTPYAVLLDTGVFIDGLTLNSPRATLQQTAGSLNISPGGIIDLQAGT